MSGISSDPSSRIKKPLTVRQYISYIILLTLLAVCAIQIRTHLHTKKQNDALAAQAANEFFHSTVPDFYNDNAAIAAFGLFLPADYGTDTYNTAAARARKSMAELQQAQTALLAAKTRDEQKPLYKRISSIIHAFRESAEPRYGVYPSIDLGSGDDCWYWKYYKASETDKTHCFSKDNVSYLLHQNRLLLQRYEALLQHDHYIDLPMQHTKDWPLIEVHRLYLLKLMYEARTAPEQALEKWLHAAHFIKRGFYQENSFRTYRGFATMYLWTLSALPVILDKPALAKKHKTELLALLEEFFPRDVPLDPVFKSEIRSPLGFVISHNKLHKTKYYRYARDYMDLVNLSTRRYPAAEKLFLQKYESSSVPDIGWNSSGLPFNIDKYLSYNYQPLGLIKDLHKVEMRQLAMNMYVRLKLDFDNLHDSKKAADAMIEISQPWNGKISMAVAPAFWNDDNGHTYIKFTSADFDYSVSFYY